MDQEKSKIVKQTKESSCSNMDSKVSSKDFCMNDNSSNVEVHNSITNNGRRSRNNSSNVSSSSFLNSMFSSMQSWQSGQNINTWMPQTL